MSNTFANNARIAELEAQLASIKEDYDETIAERQELVLSHFRLKGDFAELEARHERLREAAELAVECLGEIYRVRWHEWNDTRWKALRDLRAALGEG